MLIDLGISFYSLEVSFEEFIHSMSVPKLLRIHYLMLVETLSLTYWHDNLPVHSDTRNQQFAESSSKNLTLTHPVTFFTGKMSLATQDLNLQV